MEAQQHLHGRSLGPAGSAPTGEDCPLPGLGLLYCAALFSCCLRMWLCDLHYRARFESPSRVHRLVDVIGYLMLVYAAASIQSVHVYVRDGTTFNFFIFTFIAAQGLWILRWLEIAVMSHDEESRRFSAMRLVDDTPAILWWLGAWLLFLGDAMSAGVPILLIVGSFWTDFRLHLRVHRSALLRSCDPDGEVAHLPKDRTRVPINVEFAIHRFNEFMMLMVGEDVLQVREAPLPS